MLWIDGRRIELAVENDAQLVGEAGQLVGQVVAGQLAEQLPAGGVEGEVHARLALAVGAGVGLREVAAGDVVDVVERPGLP